MGSDLWAFIALAIVALMLFVWMICEAASQADDQLEEWAIERAVERWREEQR